MSDAARPARARASSVSREGSGRFRREKRFFFRCRDSGPTAAPRHGRMAFSSPLGTKARVEAPRARRGTHLPVLVVRPVLLRRSDSAHVRRARGCGAHPATSLRSAGATGRANKCRFLPTATRDGSRRDAPREALGGARRDGVRSHERHRRSRAHREPSAIRGHARDRRERAVCGVRDRPRAFLVRERPLHRPRKLPGTTQKPGDARTRGARFGKADATSSRQFPGFRLAISSRVSQRFSPLLLCFAKTGKALTRFSEDLTRSRI